MIGKILSWLGIDGMAHMGISKDKVVDEIVKAYKDMCESD